MEKKDNYEPVEADKKAAEVDKKKLQSLCNYLDPVRQLPSPLTTDTLLVSIFGTAIG